MTNLVAALAAAPRSLACAFGTKSLARAGGYAATGTPHPTSIASLPGTIGRQDARLGSMGWDGVAAPRANAGGGVAGGMAGDLCPKGMNRPDSTTARAAAARGTN
jgi:hypothetical protein